MPYPFGYIEPKALKQTFLRDVTIVVRYSPVALTDEIKCALTAFAEKKFGFDAFKDSAYTEDGVEVISEDNRVKFTFHPDAIHLRLRFPDYKTFNDILDLWPSVQEYLSAQNVDTVTGLKVIKYNEIRFKLPNRSQTAWDALKAFFTTDLIGDSINPGDSGKSNEDLTRWEIRREFDNDADMDVSIVYGFSIYQGDSSKGELILKPSVCRNNLQLSLNDAKEVLKDLNRLAFQAFHWSINDNIFTQLLGKL